MADPLNCSECPALTAEWVEQHVSCRLQCVHPDLAGPPRLRVRAVLIAAGTQIAQPCDSTSKYLDLIDECVPLSIAALSAFAAPFLAPKRCMGGVVAPALALEALRFCSVITGQLIITVDDTAADFSALQDIRSVAGSARLRGTAHYPAQGRWHLSAPA